MICEQLNNMKHTKIDAFSYFWTLKLASFKYSTANDEMYIAR